MMRVLVRATCLGAVAWLLGASQAVAAPQLGASASLDSFPNAPDAILWPPHPCIENDVIIYVRGYVSTPCDSFLAAYRSGDRQITIRTLLTSNRRCAVAPSVFYAVRIPFGRLPAGAQSITLSRHVLSWDGFAIQDSTVTTTPLDFTVADACPDPPPPFPAADLPFVDSVATVPSPACPDRPVDVRFRGHFQDGCGRLVSATLEGGIHLVLAPHPNPSAPCPFVIAPWTAQVSIGNVVTGSHSVLVQETLQGSDAVWPPVVDAEYIGLFDFTVGATPCDSLPGTLPFVDHLSIGSSDTSAIICANGPIQVRIGGMIPSICWSVRKIQLLPGSPTPTVRVLLDDHACTEIVCPRLAVPWDTTVVLPGLPAGSYVQRVQVGLVTCSDSVPPDRLYTTRVPFEVQPAESCGVGPPLGCLLPSWTPGASSGCNAFLDQDRAVSLGLRITTSIPLSGLQGELRFLQPGLGIASIETDGPAIGMHLTWTATATGAKFVLFAEHGAPIPASSPQPVPVLKVGIIALPIRANIPWPANGFDLEALSILGSDVNGVEVPSCPTLAIAPVIAHICFDRPCDFDGNGVADVRDLVRMVHCVNGDGPCPLNAGTQFDCNGDAQFSLDDVLCCAVHLLGGPACTDCPIDSTRDEPAVRATFDAPIVTATGIDVPLRLSGSDRLGAARLAVRFPSDRFTFAGAEAHAAPWLELHQGSEGRASIGLIRVGPDITLEVPQTVMVLLHLALKPGATLGGDVSVETGEFSGRDGVMLHVDLAIPPRALDGKPTLRIQSVHPNPSAGTFQIELAVDAPARVDVSVLDLAGRRVAQIFRGDLPAGSARLEWQAGQGGMPSRGGVYFLRASVGGQVVVRKLILLTRGPGPQAVPLRNTR